MNTSEDIRYVPLDELDTEQVSVRAKLSQDAINEYAAAYEAGKELPPIIVFNVDNKLVLVDGNHRREAALKVNRTVLPVRIIDGTLRDAILYAAGCNAEHGRPRTNEDKRKAVTMLLNDPEWRSRSDRWIADQCKVDHELVGRVRRKLPSNDASGQAGVSASSTQRVGQDGKTYKPRTRKSPPAETPAAPAAATPPVAPLPPAPEPPPVVVPAPAVVVAPTAAAPEPIVKKKMTPKEKLQAFDESIMLFDNKLATMAEHTPLSMYESKPAEYAVYRRRLLQLAKRACLLAKITDKSLYEAINRAFENAEQRVENGHDAYN